MGAALVAHFVIGETVVSPALQFFRHGSCLNADGAFGNVPGAESHAAYVYCAVASKGKKYAALNGD